MAVYLRMISAQSRSDDGIVYKFCSDTGSDKEFTVIANPDDSSGNLVVKTDREGHKVTQAEVDDASAIVKAYDLKGTLREAGDTVRSEIGLNHGWLGMDEYKPGDDQPPVTEFSAYVHSVPGEPYRGCLDATLGINRDERDKNPSALIERVIECLREPPTYDDHSDAPIETTDHEAGDGRVNDIHLVKNGVSIYVIDKGKDTKPWIIDLLTVVGDVYPQVTLPAE